ncbi:mechanosensitive ion channel family protein [Simiduia agarivorans]|uniref:Small-conductance mechanosensitive channel n=1 Tax=Simiduia agarivorans (strain DSM 21679 / JCM 13881 / BCRC 17597 / SA1) TaxID=1117647 RepID=K4KNT5_SIMAS|nr:mechanosensitive ion channel domain-containing protein [Simiduia agarivorans]AFU99905.1 MscS mechanosensitive ion channel [Simiduia agarivorans SA1 = DSM 21679]
MDTESNSLQALLDIISLEKILAIALLVLSAWVFLTLMQWLLNKLADQFPRHRLLLNRIYPLTRVLVWSGTVIYAVVGIVAPHQSILFAMLGSAGLALGLATQEPIKNMVSGLIIMINPPYRLGDMVSLAGHYGEVIKLEWSVTWLRTFDDNIIMVPNNEALRTAIANSNSGALDEQVSVKFSLPAECDHQLAMALAREATLTSPYTFLKKPIIINLDNSVEFGKALIHVTVKAWVLDIRLEKRFATDIQMRVIDAYKIAGVMPSAVVPLPQ